MHCKVFQLIAITSLVTISSLGQSSGKLASPQTNQELIVGMKLERALGPSDEHAYTAQMESGAAIIGEAVQEGIDLVIDVYGPDGKRINRLDSPNGDQGPEPIDFTALQTGLHKFVVHTLQKDAKPGKYLMKVDRILSVAENARRMAAKVYPPAMLNLWEAYATNPRAVQSFVADRVGKGPIIEPLPDHNYSTVTYLYYGDENTAAVRLNGGPHAAVGGMLMRRFMQTPLFFVDETVPNDARYCYGFAAIEMRFVGPGGSVQISEDVFAIDALNPETFSGLSVMAMPDAPAQPYIVKNDSLPQGKLSSVKLKSAALSQDRSLTIYTPPGYEGEKSCDLLIVFDGGTYGGDFSTLVPTPTILDNLIAAKKIGPTIAILVPNIAGQRDRDLAMYQPFADFIGTEVVPWARKNYRIASGSDHVVAVGSSRGGLCASYCAFKHPEVIGNVLSQSGSYWVTKDWEHPLPWPRSEDSDDLIRDFRDSKHLPINFYIEIGHFDDNGFMLGTNRRLRDVLILKGYQVTYKEFDSGHDYIWWQGSLADGLIALLGRKRD